MENNVRAILEGLNPAQRSAVEAVEGPVLIVAGAGSGKTRVLTSRVAYLLASGIEPSRILALTFTKKAAGEMKERIGLMVGERAARKVVMGTFHSVFVRFLRSYAEFLGYPEQFTIYDTSDSQSAMKVCLKELHLEQDKNYKPKDVLARISNAKNNLVTWDRYATREDLLQADRRAQRGRIADLYRLYQQKLKASGVMDFDDILVNMNILLRDNQDALHELASRFSYIMVDEYQDTNFSQYVILRKLAMLHGNICVVGDDSQSIYAFRGAKIENILNFKKDYPKCKIVRLERNYRSTQTIVDAANSVIAHNEGRIPKECYSEGEKGEKIRVLGVMKDEDESEIVAETIVAWMRSNHAQYSDFAILYRTNSQARLLEETLKRRRIPYYIYSGTSYYDRVEVKDLLAYFKLVVNPLDNESFKRVVNRPLRGIGEASIAAVSEAANARNTSLLETISSGGLESFGFKEKTARRLGEFCDMIAKFARASLTEDAALLAKDIAVESGLLEFYKQECEKQHNDSKYDILQELVGSVELFVERRIAEAQQNEEEMPLVTLSDYLEDISLLSNNDVTDEEDASNRIAMMTVHTAKGLEFPYVVIAGMEENLFPSINMMSSAKDIEEERRLFYVALTRAQKDVVLTYCHSRFRNGRHEYNSLSRFVREIDPKYLAKPLDDVMTDSDRPSSRGFGGFGGFGSRFGGNTPSKPAKPVTKPSFGGNSAPKPAASTPTRPLTPAKPEVQYDNFIPVHMTELFVGERIEHNRFGPGKILSITGVVPELKAEVEFDHYGRKTLLLKYAKMRPEQK